MSLSVSPCSLYPCNLPYWIPHTDIICTSQSKGDIFFLRLLYFVSHDALRHTRLKFFTAVFTHFHCSFSFPHALRSRCVPFCQLHDLYPFHRIRTLRIARAGGIRFAPLQQWTHALNFSYLPYVSMIFTPYMYNISLRLIMYSRVRMPFVSSTTT